MWQLAVELTGEDEREVVRDLDQRRHVLEEVPRVYRVATLLPPKSDSARIYGVSTAKGAHDLPDLHSHGLSFMTRFSTASRPMILL